MKLIIQEGNYEFSCDFENELPKIDEAVFAMCHLLGRIYPTSKVKEGIICVLEDI